MIGKIYKIYSQSFEKVYIGSTTKLLLERFLNHKRDYKQYTKGKYHFVTSFHILQYDDANIELIEEVHFEDKTDLIRRERYHIENSDCVNKRVEGRTKKEYHEQNREKTLEYMKEYYQENKEKISEQQKEYKQANRERILEQAKQYHQQNRERISEKDKKYYDQNKERISERRKEKINCSCGSVVRKQHIRRHETSKKHLKYLESLNDI